MIPSKTSLLIVAVIGCVMLSFFVCESLGKGPATTTEITTIVPEETDELLANPGMGWQTFHRTSNKDRNLVDWIPSTVHYARWGWGTLEPQPGKIDYAFLDRVLSETRKSGQQLAFRAMCCSTTPGRPYHPDWLKDVGGKILICNYKGKKGLTVPDLDDPVVLERHLNFIKRLGDRYDGHPDIDHIDLGSVGWWGEWHMGGSKTCHKPTMENREKIIDAYVAAFKKTPIIMLIGDSECLAYASRYHTGWRADCLGDMYGFSKNWCHMHDLYPRLVKEAGVSEVWKTAPVAWEVCWDMRRWVKEKWPLRFIFNYALALHGSYLNNKSAPLPAGKNVREEIERFLRRLGYRLVIREFEHRKQIRRGKPLVLTMKWQNVGSAPCYRPYRVAYRIKAKDGYVRTFVGKLTVEKWMPGSIKVFTKEFFEEPSDLPPGEIVKVSDSIVLPADIPTGTFILAIGVVGERNTEPVLRLAIKGRKDDGWYPLSTLHVLN